MTTMKNYLSKALNEGKPTSHDVEIKKEAFALTKEIESFIKDLIENWSNQGSLFFDDDEEFDKSDIAKMVNLAIKKINIKKII